MAIALWTVALANIKDQRPSIDRLRCRLQISDEGKDKMTKTSYRAVGLMEMKRVTTHPGEMLNEEFLKPLGMSARALAEQIDVPGNRLTEIIAGRRGMTADTALRLSRYFGNTAEFWMNLQTMHDLTKEIVEKRRAYRKIRPRDVGAA